MIEFGKIVGHIVFDNKQVALETGRDLKRQVKEEMEEGQG